MKWLCQKCKAVNPSASGTCHNCGDQPDVYVGTFSGKTGVEELKSYYESLGLEVIKITVTGDRQAEVVVRVPKAADWVNVEITLEPEPK